MITINGKTYKQKYFAGIYQIEEQLLKLIEEGVLEEVKEKPLSQKRAEAIERGKEVISTSAKNPILEKLREELLKLQNEMCMPLVAFSTIFKLLTSLEQPKEQPQPQEDIELLPKFDEYLSTTECIKLRVFSLEVQVELLTSTVNQLIKANKKLGK